MLDFGIRLLLIQLYNLNYLFYRSWRHFIICLLYWYFQNTTVPHRNTPTTPRSICSPRQSRTRWPGHTDRSTQSGSRPRSGIGGLVSGHLWTRWSHCQVQGGYILLLSNRLTVVSHSTLHHTPALHGFTLFCTRGSTLTLPVCWALYPTGGCFKSMHSINNLCVHHG